MTRQAIVVANWKMNGDLALIETMVSSLKDVKLSLETEIIICPSFPYLALLKSQIAGAKSSSLLKVGAQSVNEHISGAFTGEISTVMLQDLAINYVIIGHSERRNLYNETSALIAKKVNASLKAGITPILCIGESEEERKAEKTQAVLSSQLKPVI